MILNSQYSPLPFWVFGTKITAQHHIKWYTKKTVPVICTQSGGTFELPPFQIRAASIGAITVVNLVLLSDGSTTDITTEINAAGLTVVTKTGYESIVYDGATITKTVNKGEYYLTITDGTITWYSDVFRFCLPQDLDNRYIKIEWWHEEDMVIPGGSATEPHHYLFTGGAAGFKNFVYLKATPARPDYPIIEEEPEREGEHFQLHFISSKMHKFKFLATEYMLDCIRLIGGHDHIEVTYDQTTYTVDKFGMTPNWGELSDLAMTEVTFHTDTVVAVPGTAV